MSYSDFREYRFTVRRGVQVTDVTVAGYSRFHAISKLTRAGFTVVAELPVARKAVRV